jgi:hypothetical protein
MTRKLEALGLALFATLAMSATAASSAAAVVAHHFTSDSKSGVTHLTAEALTPQEFIPNSEEPEKNLVCSEISLPTETSTFEGGEVTEVTAEPRYSGCFFNETTLALVTTNGCHYTFTNETTKDSTELQSAIVHLTCPEKSTGIVVDVTALKIPCFDIEPTQAVHGILYDPMEGHIVVEAFVHQLKSETTGMCGKGTHTNGTYLGKTTLRGYSDKGHTAEITLGLKTTE